MSGLSAIVVGVKNELLIFQGLKQDSPGDGMSIAINGSQATGIRIINFCLHCGLQPVGKLSKRTGIQVSSPQRGLVIMFTHGMKVIGYRTHRILAYRLAPKPQSQNHKVSPRNALLTGLSELGV